MVLILVDGVWLWMGVMCGTSIIQYISDPSFPLMFILSFRVLVSQSHYETTGGGISLAHVPGHGGEFGQFLGRRCHGR